jgi:hypothetical protein
MPGHARDALSTAKLARLRSLERLGIAMLAGVLDLASGRFAMIDDGLGFQLVPWKPLLKRELGRQVAGVMLPGGVEWGFGKKRGPGVG